MRHVCVTGTNLGQKKKKKNLERVVYLCLALDWCWSDVLLASISHVEVACSASDRQGSNFESCVWRTASSQSSHHPQEVLLAQFSLYVHKGGLKPDSFHYHTWKNDPFLEHADTVHRG